MLNKSSPLRERLKEPPVQAENKERLIQLAAQIAVEQDHEKFMALILELNDLLDEKEKRLAAPANQSPKPKSE
jgi:hypothetical protein